MLPQNEQIQEEEWYISLVEECKAIVTESTFTSRWALVEGYHQLGERIRTDKLAQDHAKGNKTFVADLGRNLNVSGSTIYRAIQFFDKYPDLSTLPEGKNISWNKIVTKYLPEVPPEVHTTEKESEFCKCPQCGFVFKPIRIVEEKTLAIVGKKYSSIKEVGADEFQEIATTYKVSPGFVELQFEKLKNYCESKGKVYKNYKAALRNFVLGEMQRTVERRIPDATKRGVDARNL